MIVELLNRVPAPIAARFRRQGLPARALRPVLDRLVRPEITTVVVRSGGARGVKLRIYPRHEKYYWSGAYEPEVQDALAVFLRPGMSFWDVGAHAGYFSLLGSRLVGANGAVHAFEPMPENRARMLKAVELNRAANITVHPEAIAEVAGTATLHARAATSMWTLRGGEGEHGVDVRCTTLDELTDRHGPPRLVKIDAEGAELEILRGGARLLRDVRPVLIVEAAADMLAAADVTDGYRIEPLTSHHTLLV